MFGDKLKLKLRENEDKFNKENLQTINNEIVFGFIKVDSDSVLLESLSELKSSRSNLLNSNNIDRQEIIKDSNVFKKIDTNKNSLVENSFKNKLLSFHEDSVNYSQKTKNSDIKPIKIESQYDKNETNNWESQEMDKIINKNFDELNNEKVNPLSVIEEEISNIAKSKFNNISPKKLSNNKTYPQEQNEKEISEILNSNVTKELLSKNPDNKSIVNISISKLNKDSYKKSFINKKENSELSKTNNKDSIVDYDILKKISFDKNSNKKNHIDDDEIPEELSIKMESKNKSFNLTEKTLIDENYIKPKFSNINEYKNVSNYKTRKLDKSKTKYDYNTADRLMKMGNIYNNKKKISKEMKNVKEKNLCTFKPNINKKSRDIIKNRSFTGKNISNYSKNSYIKKNNNKSFYTVKKTRKEISKEYTFKPNINKKSKAIIEKRNNSKVINQYNKEYKSPRPNNLNKRKKSFVNNNSNKILIEKILDQLYKVFIDLEILNTDSTQTDIHKEKINNLLNIENEDIDNSIEEENGDIKLIFEDCLNISIAMNFLIIYNENDDELSPEQSELFHNFWAILNGEENNFITISQLTIFYLAIFGLDTKEINIDGFAPDEIREIQKNFKLFKDNKRLIENKTKSPVKSYKENTNNIRKNSKKNTELVKNYNKKLREKAILYNISTPLGKWTTIDYHTIKSKIQKFEKNQKINEKKSKEKEECTFKPIINNSSFNESKSNYFSNYGNSSSKFDYMTQKGFKNFKNSHIKNVQFEIMNNSQKEILTFNENSDVDKQILDLKSKWGLSDSEFQNLYINISNKLKGEFN